jgi:hypothetical protein
MDGIVNFGTTPVPKHCDSCGHPFPWTKGKSKTLKKVGIIGSICSIIGLGLAIWTYGPQLRDSRSADNNSIEQNNNNIAIGQNSGSVVINGSSNAERFLVLENPQGGSIVIHRLPGLDVALKPSNHICSVVGGTRVKKTGEKHKLSEVIFFEKIEILEGENAGVIGWVSNEFLTMR